MQFFILLSGLAAVRLFIEFPIPQKNYVIPIIILLKGINWWRYERNLDLKKLEEKWENEEPNKKKTKGWIIIIPLALLIFFQLL